MKLTLRPYQTAGLEAIRDCYRAGAQSVLYQAPTGAGKTALFCAIAEGARTRQGQILILVHRQELLRQCSGALDELGVSHGVIAPGHPETREHVQVASVQTVIRRLHRIQAPSLIVVDEAHHAVAGSWARVLEAFVTARVLGVTATPGRADNRGLGRASGGPFDTLVLGPTVRELIEGGFLARYALYKPPTDLDLSKVKRMGGDYARDGAAAAVDKPKITGDVVSHYRKHSHLRPAIAFCISVAHAEHVAAEFRSAGYQSCSVDGTDPDETRRRVLRDLASGALNVLTSCDLISEGVDVPRVETAILLRPTQSTALYLQQVGRCLRPAPGKLQATIIDQVGNCDRHGFPDDDREWSLDGDKQGRSSGEKDLPSHKMCKSCYAMIPRLARECDQCGEEFEGKPREIRQVDGELVEVTPEERERLRAESKRQASREQAGAQTLEELQAIGRARGYKPGWALHVWKSRKSREPA